jgi:hypothetical protein
VVLNFTVQTTVPGSVSSLKSNVIGAESELLHIPETGSLNRASAG